MGTHDQRHRPVGKTNLMVACEQGRTLEVKIILQKKPLSVASRDRNGKTALHYCAESGSVPCAQLVVSADATLLDVHDNDGFTPLHLAVIAGNRGVAKLFLKHGADPDKMDKERHSTVHWASVCGDVESLEMLLNHGANPSSPDILGAYPIHYAAQMCGAHSLNGKDPETGISTLKKLVQKGASVQCRDRDGREPMLWAASTGSSEAVLVLFAAGANVSATDKDGLTALHCAASRGHTSCVETLVTLCGARINAGDNIGCSPLFYAAAQGHADCVQVLLKYGADPNLQDDKGRTPAHCAAAKGRLEIVRILDSNGADLWIRNSRGNLPLHEAVQSGRKDLIQWLLTQCPRAVNATNISGRTPLHIAAQRNNVELCEILIDYGAYINPLMVNAKGFLMSPLDVSVYQGNQRCAKYLQLHGAVPATKVLENNEINRNLLFSLGNYAYHQKERSDDDIASATSYDRPRHTAPANGGVADIRDTQTRTIRAGQQAPLPPPVAPEESQLTNVASGDVTDASVHIHLSKDDLWSLWESLMQELTSEVSEDREGSEISEGGQRQKIRKTSSSSEVRQLKPILTNVYLRTSNSRTRDLIAGESILERTGDSGERRRTDDSSRKTNVARDNHKRSLPKVSEMESSANHDWEERMTESSQISGMDIDRQHRMDIDRQHQDEDELSDSVGSDTEHRSALIGVKVTRLRKKRSEGRTWAKEVEESETSSGHRPEQRGANPYLKRYFQRQARAAEMRKYISDAHGLPRDEAIFRNIHDRVEDRYADRLRQHTSQREIEVHEEDIRHLQDSSYHKPRRRDSSSEHDPEEVFLDEDKEIEMAPQRKKSLKSRERSIKHIQECLHGEESSIRDNTPSKTHRKSSKVASKTHREKGRHHHKCHRRHSQEDHQNFENISCDCMKSREVLDSGKREPKHRHAETCILSSSYNEDSPERSDYRDHQVPEMTRRSSSQFLEVPLAKGIGSSGSEERSGYLAEDPEEQHFHLHHHHHHSHHHHYHHPSGERESSILESSYTSAHHRKHKRHYHRKRLRLRGKKQHADISERQILSDGEYHSNVERMHSSIEDKRSKSEMSGLPVRSSEDVTIKTPVPEENFQTDREKDNYELDKIEKPETNDSLHFADESNLQESKYHSAARKHLDSSGQQQYYEEEIPAVDLDDKKEIDSNGKELNIRDLRRSSLRSRIVEEDNVHSSETSPLKMPSSKREKRKPRKPLLKSTQSLIEIPFHKSKSESLKEKSKSARIEKSSKLPKIKLFSVEGDTTDLLVSDPQQPSNEEDVKTPKTRESRSSRTKNSSQNNAEMADSVFKQLPNDGKVMESSTIDQARKEELSNEKSNLLETISKEEEENVNEDNAESVIQHEENSSLSQNAEVSKNVQTFHQKLSPENENVFSNNTRVLSSAYDERVPSKDFQNDLIQNQSFANAESIPSNDVQNVLIKSEFSAHDEDVSSKDIQNGLIQRQSSAHDENVSSKDTQNGPTQRQSSARDESVSFKDVQNALMTEKSQIETKMKKITSIEEKFGGTEQRPTNVNDEALPQENKYVESKLSKIEDDYDYLKQESNTITASESLTNEIFEENATLTNTSAEKVNDINLESSKNLECNLYQLEEVKTEKDSDDVPTSEHLQNETEYPEGDNESMADHMRKQHVKSYKQSHQNTISRKKESLGDLNQSSKPEELKLEAQIETAQESVVVGGKIMSKSDKFQTKESEEPEPEERPNHTGLDIANDEYTMELVEAAKHEMRNIFGTTESEMQKMFEEENDRDIVISTDDHQALEHPITVDADASETAEQQQHDEKPQFIVSNANHESDSESMSEAETKFETDSDDIQPEPDITVLLSELEDKDGQNLDVDQPDISQTEFEDSKPQPVSDEITQKYGQPSDIPDERTSIENDHLTKGYNIDTDIKRQVKVAEDSTYVEDESRKSASIQSELRKEPIHHENVTENVPAGMGIGKKSLVRNTTVESSAEVPNLLAEHKANGKKRLSVASQTSKHQTSTEMADESNLPSDQYDVTKPSDAGQAQDTFEMSDMNRSISVQTVDNIPNTNDMLDTRKHTKEDVNVSQKNISIQTETSFEVEENKRMEKKELENNKDIEKKELEETKKTENNETEGKKEIQKELEENKGIRKEGLEENKNLEKKVSDASVGEECKTSEMQYFHLKETESKVHLSPNKRSPERQNPSAVFYSVPTEESNRQKQKTSPDKQNPGSVFYTTSLVPGSEESQATDNSKIFHGSSRSRRYKYSTERGGKTLRSTARDRSLESEKAVAIANSAYRKLTANGELTVFNSSLKTAASDTQLLTSTTLFDNSSKMPYRYKGEYSSLEKPGFLWVHFGSGSSPVSIKKKPNLTSQKIKRDQMTKPSTSQAKNENAETEPKLGRKGLKSSALNAPNQKSQERSGTFIRNKQNKKIDEQAAKSSTKRLTKASGDKDSNLKTDSVLNVSSKVLTEKKTKTQLPRREKRLNDNSSKTTSGNSKFSSTKHENIKAKEGSTKTVKSEVNTQNEISKEDKNKQKTNCKSESERTHKPDHQTYDQFQTSKQTGSERPRDHAKSPRTTAPRTTKESSARKSSRKVTTDSQKPEQEKAHSAESRQSKSGKQKDSEEKGGEDDRKKSTPRLTETAKSSSLDEGDVRFVIERKEDPDMSIKISMTKKNKEKNKEASTTEDSGYISTSESIHRHRRSITIDLGHTTAKINTGMKGGTHSALNSSKLIHTQELNKLDAESGLPRIDDQVPESKTESRNRNTNQKSPTHSQKVMPSKLPVLSSQRQRSNSLVFLDYNRMPTGEAFPAGELVTEISEKNEKLLFSQSPQRRHSLMARFTPEKETLSRNFQRQIAQSSGRNKVSGRRSGIPIYRAHSDGHLDAEKPSPRMPKLSSSTPSINEESGSLRVTSRERKMSSIRESSLTPTDLRHSDSESVLRSAEKLKLPTILLSQPEERPVRDADTRSTELPDIRPSLKKETELRKGDSMPPARATSKASSSSLFSTDYTSFKLPLLQQAVRCRCNIQPHKFWDGRRIRSAVECFANVHFLSEEEMAQFDPRLLIMSGRSSYSGGKRRPSPQPAGYKALRTQTLKRLKTGKSGRRSRDALTFHVDHDRERNTFKLPTEKLQKNKKWQVVFTIGKSEKGNHQKDKDNRL